MAIIEAKQVSKRYGRHLALDKFNLKIETCSIDHTQNVIIMHVIKV